MKLSSPSSSEFISGIRAELPILLGVAPFGMIYGALAMTAGLSVTMAQAMSSVVFAGSAQFIAVQLIANGAPALVLLLTTFVVNIRHMLYSASVAPYLAGLRPGWKWLLAYLLTDEAYAVAILHYQQADAIHRRDAENAKPWQKVPLSRDVESAVSPYHPVAVSPYHPVAVSPCHPVAVSPCHPVTVSPRHYYLLGAGLALWLTWQFSTAIGITLGAAVPPGWGLDFALPLTFIALLAPVLRDRPAVVAALMAGIVALIAAGWPYKLGLVAAALTGIAAGAWADRRGSPTDAPTSHSGQAPGGAIMQPTARRNADAGTEALTKDVP